MKANELKVEKTYLRRSPRFGRTTTLVVKATGVILGEWVGCLTKKDCMKQVGLA